MDRGSGATGDRAHAYETNSTGDDEIWLIEKPQMHRLTRILKLER
jgi:hypothetical protein